MRPISLSLLFVLLLGGSAFPEAIYYRSNSQGMLLERIPSYRRDESPWVMSVSRTGSAEVRVLLQDGKEVTRWESSTSAAQTVERELSGGELVATRVYDRTGRLLQEELSSGGAVTQKTLYSYVGDRLTRARILDPEGTVVSTINYLYATNGSLRAVRRTGAAGASDQTSVVAGSGGVFEERTGSGDVLLISRYDGRGRLASSEERKAGAVVSRQDYVYAGDSAVLASSIERRPVDGTVIERGYDTGGRLIRESTTAGSKAVTVDAWVRDAKGNVVSRTRRGPGGLEQWLYTLRDDGTVSREEYSRRGSLEKVTIYVDAGHRIEELYSAGEMFLRVFYEADQRVKEEIWADGSLVRTRTFP